MSKEKELFVVAVRQEQQRLGLYAVKAISRGDAASVLYEYMRKNDVVDLPPIAWVVQVNPALDVAHFATI